MNVTVNGLVYAPGSSIVTLFSMWPRSFRVHRSIVCSCSVCGCPAIEPELVVVADRVDDQRVLSHRPIEWPYQVGSRSAGCLRPSMKICR